MGSSSRIATLLVQFIAVVVLVVSVEATTYTVGGTSGWRVPTDPSFYSTWASTITFRSDDILEFNFASGSHDVALVTEEAYTNCNNNVVPISSSSPVRVPLTASSYFFICTLGNLGSHCNGGQKFKVAVSTNSSATSPPPPSANSPPSPSATSPPPPSATSPPPPSATSPPSPSDSASVAAAASVVVFGLLVYVAAFLI